MQRILVAWILLAIAASPAVAAEQDAGTLLLKELTALRKAANLSELADALGRVPAAYNGSGKGVQGKLRSELGKILKDANLGDARRPALRALLKLDDSKASWKEVSKVMPSARLEVAGDFEIAVVGAAGQLAQSKAVKPLLDLAAKAKDGQLAAASAKALGGFKDEKKLRVKILADLIALGKRAEPAQASGGKAASPETVKRWEVLQPALVAGLNDLTGRALSTFEEWAALHAENKKNLKALFPQEE